MRRADGLPWALAGIWSEWLDPESGEVLPNYTMITCNCDGHPLLGRLHKPDPKLPPEAQDKRAVVHIAPEHWHDWLSGDSATALQLIKPEAAEAFDADDARRTDALLAQQRGGGLPQQGSLL
jgi:putative SOS response-associated peptidase YedK